LRRPAQLLSQPTMSTKAAGKKRAASTEPELDELNEDDRADLEIEDEAGPSTSASTSTPAPARKSKSTSNSNSKNKKRKTLIPGIVYISRLPPGMTPQKVKYLMAQWGDVGKIYAQKKDAPTGYNPDAGKKKKKEKHAAANYSEAWVEFLDKNVGKTVASMMNAQVIGGKKGDR